MWPGASGMRGWSPLTLAAQPLIGSPALAHRLHCDPVLERELLLAQDESDILKIGIVPAKLEVVDDPSPNSAAQVLERTPVNHGPLLDRLVWPRLTVDQVRMRKHREEDLHVRLGTAGAKGERLAEEVRHSVQRRLIVEVHLHGSAAATALAHFRARKTLVGWVIIHFKKRPVSEWKVERS